MRWSAPNRSVAGCCGPRRRLRMWLGLQVLSAQTEAEATSRDTTAIPARPPRRLPSVRALAAAAGVHRNTAAAVYRDLERFGLVECIRGAGTFAVPASDARAPGWGQGRDASCPTGDLAAVLAAELGRPVVEDGGGFGGPLLLPLDATPPTDRTVIPVAPLGPALCALRSLPPGSTVILVSASPRLGRLLRHTLCALHGDGVGLLRVAGERSESMPVADLQLVDLLQLDHRGTDSRTGVLTPLRLVPYSDRRAG